jgi:hypothetical protein
MLCPFLYYFYSSGRRGKPLLHASLEVLQTGLKQSWNFKESMGAIGTEEEEGYRTGPPGYISWRNSLLGIDSGAPYTFKNTGSGVKTHGGICWG